MDKLPQAAGKIAVAAGEIAVESTSIDDCRYMHAIMCQVGLPRSRVDGTSFERNSGGVVMRLEAGQLWNGEKFVQQPLPYGALPRLIMVWLNSYAVRFHTPVVPIGESASEFMRMLGKTPNGGRNSVYATFRHQVPALAACRMMLGFNANGLAHTYDGKPIKHFAAWIASGEQRALWPASITFSDEYYQTLTSHAVPLDNRALMALSGSAMAIDVYSWLAHRLWRLPAQGIRLGWAILKEQFGQEFRDPRNFRKAFLIAVRQTLEVYRSARVQIVSGGLELRPSPPPVSRKSLG